MNAPARQPELLSVGGPEGARWRAIEPAAPNIGYASFYHADDLAALPVRAITRIKDNKSDPNIETGTYGLFSTCQEQMRAGIVKHSARYVFFFTRPPHSRERALTGMYELAAWTPGALGEAAGDFALAAAQVRFVRPILVSELHSGLVSPLSTRWRLTKKLDHEQSAALAALIGSRPDMTPEYLAEIDRLERINKFQSGCRYPTWLREAPWSWADAADYLKPVPKDAERERVSNASPTGWWGCMECNAGRRPGGSDREGELMARRAFLSYQHRDEGRAKGFDLLRRAPKLNVNYSVRHQMQRVNSTDDSYVGRRIRSQIKGTSVTVVLIGAATAGSAWVAKEIEWSLAKQPANGLLGIVIDPGATVPEGLSAAGAELIDWTEPGDVHEFEAAIERAALAAARGPAIATSAGSGSSCGR